MKPSVVKKMLDDVSRGKISAAKALARLKHLPFEEIGHSTLDRHRALRQGFPEVIFCEGKTIEEIEAIAERICAGGENLIATRATIEVFRRLKRRFPKAAYHARARVVTVTQHKLPLRPGIIAVVSAGTADAHIAEEAAVTAEMLGNTVRRYFDIGVAGLHRVISKIRDLSRARVIIVVAGMEGALPSVVGGLVDKPVIAVPTSVGYGASFGGIAALLGMLNSCVAGVTVVNIDNGFGAGYAAALINKIPK